MTDHQIHDRLPSGFAYANAQQTEAFNATGSIAGAAKVCLIRKDFGQVDVAVRLRPPHKIQHVQSGLGREAALKEYGGGDPQAVKWYIAQYNAGRAASKRAGQGNGSEAWNSGMTPHAWDDGYLDYAAGRPKWHLTYCLNHDECGEG